MFLLKYILYPAAWIYGLIIKLRNWLFDKGIIKSYSFDIPVIGVGNLSVGGTGKTPMTEYLIELLYKDFKVAVLSRGYGRETRGFVLADQYTTAEQIGDEPLQYFHKYGNKIIVAVDENRVKGVKRLLSTDNKIQVILLDDSFQHRKIKPGLNILLTRISKLYTEDRLLPVGTLRDVKTSAKRADMIVVTKTDIVLSPIVVKDVVNKLKPEPYQKVFFSYQEYGKFKPVPGTDAPELPDKKPYVIILFTGIACSWPIISYLKRQCTELITLKFKDHHKFKRNDIKKILDTYNDHYSKNKIIVTTEKDTMRLLNSPYFSLLNKKPLYYLPVKTSFHKEYKEEFNKKILDYVRENKGNG